MDVWVFIILWLLFVFFGGFGKKSKQKDMERIIEENKKTFRERKRARKRGSVSKKKKDSPAQNVWGEPAKPRRQIEYKSTGNFWQDISDLANQVRKEIDDANKRAQTQSTVSSSEAVFENSQSGQALQSHQPSRSQKVHENHAHTELTYGQSYDDIALSKNLHKVEKEKIIVRKTQEEHAAKARAMRDKRLTLEAELAKMESKNQKPSFNGNSIRDLFYFKELIDKPLSLRE